MARELPRRFADRQALVRQVHELTPWLEPEQASDIHGGRVEDQKKLARIDPLAYGRTRNHLDGKVTGLSPYIRHGILSLQELYTTAVRHTSSPAQVEKFIQELAWRDYWQRLYRHCPEYIWQDIEPWKTGFTAADYADSLPEDIRHGHTGVACIDQFICELTETGYLHNHARMYVAAYIIHWRRIKWQAGARWFLHHLLDADPASNNLSWQWVASTFSNRPYIFNLENVRKYAGPGLNTSSTDNAVLDDSYENLSVRLFARPEPPE